ncbi:ABC transporter permease [Halovenus rubra]|uniref:ABC transporter permease n=2 Tax=Halovenus rubra TaxID=869890 RepID=A0ABD5XCH5_9EURY|nr:ABC transporter permease [Halovenus rubra]
MEYKPLTERVREQPRPAAVWLLGVALLLAVELGRITAGLVSAGDATVTALETGYGGLTNALAAGGTTGLLSWVGFVLLLALVGLAVATWTRATVVLRVTDRIPLGPQRLLDGLVFGLAIGGVGWLALRTGAVELGSNFGDVLRSAFVQLGDLPTLTARETIPNQGYQTPDGSWHGTFLGLSSAVAWAVRVLVVHLYVAAWLGWLWVGFQRYRTYYRQADWTPRDDVVARLRYHRWGQFGLVIVVLFLTMAAFAPSLGTTTAEQNLYAPFSNSITYYDAGLGQVTDTLVGNANLETRSQGYPGENVGPLSYDRFDRFHPFGTLTNGKDLFTFLVHGARVSLLIGLLSVAVSAILATGFALISAYYRGLADLVLVVTGDTIMGVPRLLLLILLTVLMADTWLGGLYDGGVLLALILAATGWPFLWRAFRGPTLQIAEEDWVDAARSYGQSATGIMRLHMLPYLLGYLLIYSSLVLGGVILAVAGLSFLGLGITSPTPEWGRAVDLGREFVATESWHISLIPGIMVTLVVMGFNAVGDALRDAVDPQSDSGVADASETESRGGGV